MRSSGWRKHFAGATFKDQTVQLRLRRLPFRSFHADDAADAATLGAAAGRAQAASGAVACAASAAMACGAGAASAARSVEDSVCGAHGDASGDASAHGEGRGQARGEASAMGLCGPAPQHPRTPKAEHGPPETTTALHEGYNPTAEGAASDRWPGSKRCRCGRHAPGGF